MDSSSMKERYVKATDSFVSKVKDDINVIAILVMGSLSYDVVWEKSDVDMTVVVRDQKMDRKSYCIIEDGITFNVTVVPRTMLKRHFESAIGGSIPQAYLAKGRIVYTKDDTLYDLLDDLKQLGSDDIALSAFTLSSALIDLHQKSEKWLKVKKDLLYAQYYLLKAAEVIAKMELVINGEIPIRESIQKVMEFNPELMKPFYEVPMSHLMTETEIEEGIKKIDAFLEGHLDIISKPVLDLLKDGEMKTVSMIAAFYNLEPSYIIEALDYLFEKGVIVKVSQTIRLTPKGKLAVEEIGYLYI